MHRRPFILILSLLLTQWIGSNVAQSSDDIAFVDKPHPVHVIVIDAGSTGTRLNYFIFYRNETAPYKLVLDKVITRDTRPGISSYTANPTEAYQSIVNLIKETNVSPDGADLLVKATAGIRLLAKKNKDLAHTIMKSIYEHLRATYNGTLNIWEGGISVLSGIREGDFGWLALHFLSTTGLNQNSHGVMDMGGASTQITFEYNKVSSIPDSVEAKFKTPDNFFSNLDALGRSFHLYSHSYLGLGINAGRIMSLNVPDNCLANAACTDKPPVATPCLHEKFSDTLRSGPYTVKVKGEAVSRAELRFQLCLKTMDKVMTKAHQIGDHEKLFPYFVLRSGFYYTFSGSGLVPKEGATVTLRQIENKAKEMCQNVVAEGKYAPYYCMNYCYFLSLLRDGYGFAWDQTFHSFNKVNRQTPDWALGLAVKEAYAHMYQRDQEEEILNEAS